ncbi:MAG: hypothetical protein ACTS3F_15035 [Phycisphaerales bacterium]
MPNATTHHLHAQHPLVRSGITVLVLVLLGGYFVSGVYMAWHYEQRDSRAGLTIDDIQAAYHGVNAPSPLVESLRSGHPESLDDRERTILLEWLAGQRLDQDFDNLDLGEDAPSEIIAFECLSCHARNATGQDAYPRVPLEYWDDVRSIAYSIDVRPNDRKIVAASLHAHAPSMAIIMLVLAGLALLTRFPHALTGAILTASSLGLLADLSGQWLARDNSAWVTAIVGGGVVYAAGTAMLALMVVAGCWLPFGNRRNGPRQPE